MTRRLDQDRRKTLDTGHLQLVLLEIYGGGYVQ